MIGYKEKAHPRGDKSPGPIKRGLGLSIHTWGGAGHTSACDVTIHADGSVIVGFGTAPCGTQALRWTRAGSMQTLGDLSGVAVASRAYDVSSDGATVVGVGRTAQGEEAS